VKCAFCGLEDELELNDMAAGEAYESDLRCIESNGWWDYQTDDLLCGDCVDRDESEWDNDDDE